MSQVLHSLETSCPLSIEDHLRHKPFHVVIDGNLYTFVYEFATVQGFVLDFAEINKRYDFEVDGPQHETKKARRKDGFRKHLHKRDGWVTSRFKPSEITPQEVRSRLISLSTPKECMRCA